MGGHCGAVATSARLRSSRATTASIRAGSRIPARRTPTTISAWAAVPVTDGVSITVAYKNERLKNDSTTPTPKTRTGRLGRGEILIAGMGRFRFHRRPPGASEGDVFAFHRGCIRIAGAERIPSASLTPAMLE